MVIKLGSPYVHVITKMSIPVPIKSNEEAALSRKSVFILKLLLKFVLKVSSLRSLCSEVSGTTIIANVKITANIKKFLKYFFIDNILLCN